MRSVFRFESSRKLRAAIEDRVPVGYEDETGFHYGMKASDWVLFDLRFAAQKRLMRGGDNMSFGF